MHILGTHVRHTPRAQSLLPARLPFPPLPVRPFHHDRRVSSLARTARSIGLPTGATPIQSSCTRSLSLFSVLFCPSLSFVPLPRVCLLRSLVGIIPRQGNYRYPELHNATLTHVYNRRHTPANISRYWYAWRQLTMKILTPDMNTLPRDFFSEQTRSVLIENAPICISYHVIWLARNSRRYSIHLITRKIPLKLYNISDIFRNEFNSELH